MKKYRYATLAALFALASTVIVSCNRKDDLQSPENPRTEVKFSSNIIKMDTHTRASGSAWDAADAIGVYMFAENEAVAVENKRNVEYVTESGGETGQFKAKSTEIYFPDNGDKVRFMGYYPYQSSVPAEVYAVNVSDQSSQPSIDLLYSFDADAKYDKKTPDKKVPLVFDHQLTKIYVNVKAGEGLSADALQTISVSFLGMNTQANFSLVNGTLSGQTAPAEITARPLFAKDGFAASFEAIVLPAQETSGAQIKFDLQNGDTETDVQSDVYIWSFIHALDKSTKYTYNVTINRTGIVVEATINDWTATDEQDVSAE